MENKFKWHPASEFPTETGRYLTYVNWRRVSDMIAWSAIPEVDIND